jgi:hypothetical protein
MQVAPAAWQPGGLDDTYSGGGAVEETTYSPSALPFKIQAKIHVDEAGCWAWTGSIAADGYGRIMWPPVAGPARRKWIAHRLVYELLIGPIPDRLVLDHLCRVRHCVNPVHMEPVTLQENSRRAYSGGRPNTNGKCRRGLHPWIPANIFIDLKSGNRRCHQCALAQARQQTKTSKHGKRARPGSGQGTLL